MTATRLRLLCHGATAATRASAFPADEPLDERALARLDGLAARLSGVDRVVASPARAALETAAGLGLAPDADEGLRDLDVGRWRGHPLADVLAEDPDGVAAWMSDPLAAPHGGETLAALVDRTGAWLDAAATGGRVLAITHAGVMRAAVAHVLGAPAQAFRAIDVAPLAVLDFSHDGRRWRWRCAAG